LNLENLPQSRFSYEVPEINIKSQKKIKQINNKNKSYGKN